MNRLTYIDGNSVGHAANTGAKTRLYAGSQETTAVFGFIRSLQVILRTRTAAKPVVLWDGRAWRFEFFPEYKGARTATPEKLKEREVYKAQAPLMRVACHLLGVRQLIASNMEADDLAAILARDASRRGDTVALVTGDKDWLQMVDANTVWVDHKSMPERKCNLTDFKAFTGYNTQKAFVHSKALIGDSGDNVKPRTGVGKDLAPLLLAAFPCVHTFLATPIAEAEDRYFIMHGKQMSSGMRKLHSDKEVQARFEWALQLMDLGHPKIPAPIGLKLTRAPLNRPAFEQLCGKLAFHSLLKDMDRFILPFTHLDKEYS